MKVASVVVILFLSLNLCAMQRAQALMRFVRQPQALVSQSRIASAYANDFAKNVRALIRTLETDPHVQFENREKLNSAIHTVVLRHFNILDPSQLPIALDIANAIKHELAPAYLKKTYLHTNYRSIFSLPYEQPEEHASNLYQNVLRFGIWSSNSPYFPRKVLELNPSELRRFIKAVSTRICEADCLDCQRGKEQVENALRAHQSFMNL